MHGEPHPSRPFFTFASIATFARCCCAILYRILSRISTAMLTCDIDTGILSVCPSVCPSVKVIFRSVQGHSVGL